MKKHLPFIIFMFVFMGLNLFKIVTDVRPFFDWDEAIYAQVGREMMKEKSYLVPLWQGRAWLDKPPLPPLMYGLVSLLPMQNEISMRALTILLSAVALILLYVFSLKYAKSIVVSLCAVIITSFLPAFLQRTQGLNVDVFLLIGWLGYVLWYRNLWLGAFFLAFGVLSKSLLGLYPLAMVFLYEVWLFLLEKKKRKSHLVAFIKIAFIQAFLASAWFICMLLFYGYDFIEYHIIDSHFKRVTASIEQHFGQRTFYIDLLVEQLKYAIIPVIVSLVVLGYQWLKNRSKDAFFLAIFVPWFLFLNLTKTKIAWYLYPVIPQFALLSVYPLRYIKNQWIQSAAAFVALGCFFFFMVPPSAYMTTDFSKWEDHVRIAQKAHTFDCKNLDVLVNESTRSSYATLKSMDLVIHTTTWWGNHPSIAYYSQGRTTYYYRILDFQAALQSASQGSCFITEKEDWNGDGLTQLSTIGKFVLGRKP